MGTVEILTPWGQFSDPERKRKFAALARVRPDTTEGRFEAASLSFPKDADTALVYKAAEEYPFDPIVLEEKARLAKVEPLDQLPTKAQQARDIYNIAMGAKSESDRLAAHKLYADLMGYVQKPLENTGGGNTTYNDNRSVILLPRRSTNIDEWEAEAVEHQARLVADAAK